MKFLLVAVLVTAVVGDLYLLGPRGSNNRLNEQGRERNNANRFVQIKIFFQCATACNILVIKAIFSRVDRPLLQVVRLSE